MVQPQRSSHHSSSSYRQSFRDFFHSPHSESDAWSLPIRHGRVTLIHPRSIMSWQNNPQPFPPQNGASVHPTGGLSQSLSHPTRITHPPASQPACHLPGYPANGVQNLPFTNLMPLLRGVSPDDQPRMPGQPMGAGSMLLIQERALNPDIAMNPPSRVDPAAIYNDYHPAGVPLAMNTVEHRWVSPSAERKAKLLPYSLALSAFPVPEYYQAPALPPTSNHQCPCAKEHTGARMTLNPSRSISYRKQPRLAATFDANIIQVQARCAAAGGDPITIALLPAIFVEGISQQALMRQMTSSEASDYHGGRAGQVYRVLLRIDEDKRFYCRLCAIGADEGGWKHPKDALRHLKRNHFGLGTHCVRW
jgi:hypothetical protein